MSVLHGTLQYWFYNPEADWWVGELVNSLTPMSDQGGISPYNINTISTRQVMKIKKTINLGIIGWSNIKFSELT